MNWACDRRLQLMGSVGVLEAATRKRLVTDLRATYQRLLATGTFIDRRILNRSLAAFGLPPI